MEFFETVAKRRSVRVFTDEKVPDEVMQNALTAALLAPNSSNMQPWEFYRVKSDAAKKQLAAACLNQSAARTASELVVAISRVDTWRRNRDLLVKEMSVDGELPKQLRDYYHKIVPFIYWQDPMGALTLVKRIVFTALGLAKPTIRGPFSRAQLFEMVTKTTALGCENLMLALVAQGYDSCPMEGFDERRVKRLLKLGRHSHVVMVLGVGKAHTSGIWGKQVRLPQSYFVHEI